MDAQVDVSSCGLNSNIICRRCPPSPLSRRPSERASSSRIHFASNGGSNEIRNPTRCGRCRWSYAVLSVDRAGEKEAGVRSECLFGLLEAGGSRREECPGGIAQLRTAVPLPSTRDRSRTERAHG